MPAAPGAIILFGGIFNHMYFGIPLFGWIFVLMAIFGAICFAIWWLFYWWPLTPYHGILWCTILRIGASWVFDENMKFDLITDRSAKVIFNESFKSAQDAEDDHTKTPVATIGKVSADFIFDPDKATYPNSYQHKVIETIALDWNRKHPQDQVRTLIKFYRYLGQGKFDESYAEELKHLKRKMLVPWSRIHMMYKDRVESGTFGFIMTLANTIRTIEQATYNMYGILFLGFFGALDIVIIVMWFITRKPV